MVPGIVFSRRPAPEPESHRSLVTSAHPTTLVGSARDAWRSRTDQDIAADSVPAPTLSCRRAPGGLAQLYTEHIGLLIREPIATGPRHSETRHIIARSEQRALNGTGPSTWGIRGPPHWRNGTDAVTVPAAPVRLVRRDDDVLIAHRTRRTLLAPRRALRSHGLAWMGTRSSQARASALGSSSLPGDGSFARARRRPAFRSRRP